MIRILADFCFFSKIANARGFGRVAVFGDAAAHEVDFAFEFASEFGDGFEACDVAGKRGNDDALAFHVGFKKGLFEHLFGDELAWCFAVFACVDTVLDECKNALFAELFESVVVRFSAKGGVIVEFVVVAVDDNAIGRVKGSDNGLWRAVRGVDEFDAKVAPYFHGFARLEANDFVWQVDVLVFADGFEDGCGKGCADDWRVVFGGKVGHGADVVEVGMGDDNGRNVLAPVVDDAIVGDSFGFFEARFGDFDE